MNQKPTQWGSPFPSKCSTFLIGKSARQTKQIFFSTVGPEGLFRSALLLRVRKTDIRREPGYMCCVRNVTLDTLGGWKFRLHRRTESLSSHSHSDYIPQHEERTTGSFIKCLWASATPSRVLKFPWMVPRPALGFESPTSTAPHKHHKPFWA